MAVNAIARQAVAAQATQTIMSRALPFSARQSKAPTKEMRISVNIVSINRYFSNANYLALNTINTFRVNGEQTQLIPN